MPSSATECQSLRKLLWGMHISARVLALPLLPRESRERSWVQLVLPVPFNCDKCSSGQTAHLGLLGCPLEETASASPWS
eukprot:1145125-Pelagomonas_calceolata.AAC.6